MNLSKRILFLVVTATAFANAAASSIFLYSQGTISTAQGPSKDELGLFGPSSLSLDGLAYSMTTTFDTALASTYSQADQKVSYNGGMSSVSVTINGVTVNYAIGGSVYGEIAAMNARSLGSSIRPDQISSFVTGSAGGANVFFGSYAASYLTAFMPSVINLPDSYGHSVVASDQANASMSIEQNGVQTYFNARPTFVGLNELPETPVASTDVPEPGSLFLCGAAAVAALYFRRKQRAKKLLYA